MTEGRPPFESTDQPPLANFVTETVRKPDGRQVTYYSWPDRADDRPPDAHPAGGEPQPRPDRV